MLVLTGQFMGWHGVDYNYDSDSTCLSRGKLDALIMSRGAVVKAMNTLSDTEARFGKGQDPMAPVKPTQPNGSAEITGLQVRRGAMLMMEPNAQPSRDESPTNSVCEVPVNERKSQADLQSVSAASPPPSLYQPSPRLAAL